MTGLRPRLVRRQLTLGGVALLAGAASLAVAATTRPAHSDLPQPVGSYTALAGSLGAEAAGRHTACGVTIRPSTVGVAHPTLPCGARVYLSYRGVHVLARVIDRRPYAAGRQFGLTDALARELSLRGVQKIHWSYARAR